MDDYNGIQCNTIQAFIPKQILLINRKAYGLGLNTLLVSNSSIKLSNLGKFLHISFHLIITITSDRKTIIISL